ncbi:hypothetical protein MMC19_001445 [Ptychographa xylographoides]|nr:hypothetical protein [Ptychographa xylographoides]
MSASAANPGHFARFNELDLSFIRPESFYNSRPSSRKPSILPPPPPSSPEQSTAKQWLSSQTPFPYSQRLQDCLTTDFNPANTMRGVAPARSGSRPLDIQNLLQDPTVQFHTGASRNQDSCSRLIRPSTDGSSCSETDTSFEEGNSEHGCPCAEIGHPQDYLGRVGRPQNVPSLTSHTTRDHHDGLAPLRSISPIRAPRVRQPTFTTVPCYRPSPGGKLSHLPISKSLHERKSRRSPLVINSFPENEKSYFHFDDSTSDIVTREKELTNTPLRSNARAGGLMLLLEAALCCGDTDQLRDINDTRGTPPKAKISAATSSLPRLLPKPRATRSKDTSRNALSGASRKLSCFK